MLGVAVAVEEEEDIALSMSASKSMIRFPTSTSGQLSLSSKSKSWLAAFLDFLGLLGAEGLGLLAAELTVTGGSSCIGRAKQMQLHGEQKSLLVPSISFFLSHLIIMHTSDSMLNSIGYYTRYSTRCV